MEVFYTDSLREREFEQILSVLRAGGVIGFPTDTAYGLGADPFNEHAVSQIFSIKGRPEDKPILLLVDSLEMTERITLPNPWFHVAARAFWPGPLTMILRTTVFPSNVTAGAGTVGVRWPAAPFAVELVRRFGNPITATSANRSGSPSCITAEEVRAQLGGSIEMLIDGGELPSRGGSTLLDLTAGMPTLRREGPVTFETLRNVFGSNLRKASS